jgi:hypothetical protein
MNRVLAGARRGDRTGVLARLTGSSTLDTDTPRSERLTRLLDEREQPLQAGDPDALAFTEHRIDRLFQESRAARKPADAGHPPGGDRGQPVRESATDQPT